MTYRITLASNPRVLVIFFISIALPVGGVLLTVLFHVFLGIIVTIVGGFFAWHLAKFGIKSMKSWVKTDEESITIYTADDDPRRLEWNEITHSGLVTQPKTRDQVFVYAEESDKLFAIPDEYSGFGSLVANIEENTPFEEITLEQTETVTEYLRSILGVPEPSDEESDETVESTDSQPEE